MVSAKTRLTRGTPGSGVLDMERDIYKRQRENESGDFEIAPVPPFYHLARDQCSEDSEERCVRDGGRGTADPCGCEDGDPARGPEGGERRKRPAGDWQPASPVRDRRQEEARDDGAGVAEAHLVHVPVHGRKCSRNRVLRICSLMSLCLSLDANASSWDLMYTVDWPSSHGSIERTNACQHS